MQCSLSFLDVVLWILVLFVLGCCIRCQVPPDQRAIGRVNVSHVIVLGLVIGGISTIVATISLVRVLLCSIDNALWIISALIIAENIVRLVILFGVPLMIFLCRTINSIWPSCIAIEREWM